MLAAAATGIQVGAAIVATRFVVDETTPIALALMRYAIGFVCLLPAALLARLWADQPPNIATRNFPPLATMKNSIGIDSIMLVREASNATRRALFFTSSGAGLVAY